MVKSKKIGTITSSTTKGIHMKFLLAFVMILALIGVGIVGVGLMLGLIPLMASACYLFSFLIIGAIAAVGLGQD